VHFLVKPAFLLFLLVATASSAWSADGRVLSFEGDVRVNGQPITADTVFYREDNIVTAAGASVKIVLSDNSVLDLDSESEIRLSDYSFNPSEPASNKSDINIVEGTLRYVSGLIAKEDPEDIGFTAGNSTIGVRGSFTEIEVDGVVVNVEAMIGVATLTEEIDGEKDTVVVPTGQATQKDPTTGEVVVVPATSINKVNAVVQAIAAAAPDATTGTARDEGCSESGRPLRTSARPDYDAETAAAIEALLAALNESELMMVMAVLINNARHLCIDTSTIIATIGVIATVSPENAAIAVLAAAIFDPENVDDFVNEAIAAAPEQAENIEQARDTAQDIQQGFNPSTPPQAPEAPPKPADPPDIEDDIPPGGNPGEDPPSPE
jgi:hypothetical protein